MKLVEFFGRTLDPKASSEKDDKDFSNDDLFNYILDNDSLHKKYFFPLAKKIDAGNKKGNLDKQSCLNDLMEMVKQGCREFYEDKKMKGKLKKLFPKDMRDAVCEKLYDHYYEHIVKDKAGKSNAA